MARRGFSFLAVPGTVRTPQRSPRIRATSQPPALCCEGLRPACSKVDVKTTNSGPCEAQLSSAQHGSRRSGPRTAPHPHGVGRQWGTCCKRLWSAFSHRPRQKHVVFPVDQLRRASCFSTRVRPTSALGPTGASEPADLLPQRAGLARGSAPVISLFCTGHVTPMSLQGDGTRHASHG